MKFIKMSILLMVVFFIISGVINSNDPKVIAEKEKAEKVKAEEIKRIIPYAEKAAAALKERLVNESSVVVNEDGSISIRYLHDVLTKEQVEKKGASILIHVRYIASTTPEVKEYISYNEKISDITLFQYPLEPTLFNYISHRIK